MHLCLHYKFILDRRCQFSSQILVLCWKFWFSAFIWRKLQLNIIECSQVLTVRMLVVKERVVSVFNASRAVILMSRTGMAVEKRKNFRRFRIGCITCWEFVTNAWAIGRIIGSDSRSHFETPQSHVNHSETYDSVRFRTSWSQEMLNFWTTFLCLWTAASKTESEEIFTSLCDRWRKIGLLR